MTYSRRCPHGTARASYQLQPSLSGFARRYANGYSVSFTNDTRCPSAPEQYKKFYF
ncbi:MAG: hypothetical protein F6K56_32310 [Moorea sp. SIO3G5]|nr:hypothetical protein [Moorena sp. SIO3G5]